MGLHLTKSEDCRVLLICNISHCRQITVHQYSCNEILITIVKAEQFEFQLCCLMIPGLRKDIQCHVRPYSFPMELNVANH